MTSLGFSSDEKQKIGIEIKEDALKLIFFKRKLGQWQVSDIELILTREMSEAQISAELVRLLKTHHVKDATGVLILPRNLLFVRYLKLPTHQPEELRKMMSYQIGRHLPYDPHEVVYDFIPLAAEGDYTRVLLVAVTKKVVEKYISLLKAAELPVLEVLFSTQLFEKVYEQLGVLDEKSEEITAFLDFDYGTTNLIILKGSQILFTRSIHLSFDISEENFMRHLIGEIDLSLTVLRKEEPRCLISKMILSGNLERAPVFKEELNRYFRIPIETMAVEKSTIFQWEKREQMWMRLKQFRISVTALLGLCLERKEPLVNLVPEEFKTSMLQQVRNKQTAGSLILAAAVFGMAFLCGVAYLQTKKSELRTILSQLTDNRQQSKGLVNMIQKLDMIQDYSLKRLRGLEVLAELHQMLPPDVVLNSVNCDLGGDIKIRGYAKTNTQVTDLLISLQQSKYFTKEELVSSRERKIQREEVAEFTIQCQLKK